MNKFLLGVQGYYSCFGWLVPAIWKWLLQFLAKFRFWKMTANLTRFYFDFDEECRTGCFVNLAYKDVETIEADEYERELQSQDVPYTRVDL
jgi:hypothetical protein